MDCDFKLIPNETALLVIDMQNGFVDENGTCGSYGQDISPMRSTIDPVRRLVTACRNAGIIDIWTKQEHYPDDITRRTHKIATHTRKSGASKSPALVRTWDSEIIKELQDLITPETEIIRKHRFSAFYDTRLATLLRMKNINFLIICGVSTPLCVETTTRDAYQRDFDVIVSSDATATLDRQLHENSLRAIGTFFAQVSDTDEIIRLIDSSR